MGRKPHTPEQIIAKLREAEIELTRGLTTADVVWKLGVLRVYLPTCNAGEMKTVFGPVGSYVLQDEDPSVFLRSCLIIGTAGSEKSSSCSRKSNKRYIC